MHTHSSVTVTKLLHTFLTGKCANTLTAYTLDLGDFTRYLGASSLPASIATLLGSGHTEANALAVDYRNALIARGLQPATVNRRLATLRALVKLAVKLGLVHWSLRPDKLPSQPYRDTKGPGVEAVARMIQLLTQRQTPLSVRNLAILRLLFDRGLRRGEVAALDLADVDLALGTVAVRGKGRLSKQALVLPEPTRQALAAWLKLRGTQPGPLFTSATSGQGRRITGKLIYRMLAKLGEHTGVTAKPHGIRHTAITEALNQTNGNIQAVQRFSRHKDVRIVLAYDDNRQDLAGQVANLVAKRV